MSETRTSARLNRREFAGLLAGTALPTLAASQAPQTDPQPDYVLPPRPVVPDALPFAGKLEFAAKPVPPKAEPFPMTQVRLLPNNVFHDAQKWNRGYMARLDADRMLYTFRANAGLPLARRSRWEVGSNRKTASAPVSSAVISPAISSPRARCSTPPPETRPRSRRPTTWSPRWPSARRSLAASISAPSPPRGGTASRKGSGCGRPSTPSTRSWPACGTCIGSPATSRRSRCSRACRPGPMNGPASKTDEHMQRILTIEFGGIAETLYDLAAETNNARWGKVGDRFQKRSFITPLAAAPRRAPRPPRQHAYPAGDRRGSPLRDLGRLPVPRCRRLLLRRSEHRPLVCDRRHQQRRSLAGRAAAARGGIEDEHQHRRMLLCLQHAEARAALYSWQPGFLYFDYYERLLLNHRIGTSGRKWGPRSITSR